MLPRACMGIVQPGLQAVQAKVDQIRYIIWQTFKAF